MRRSNIHAARPKALRVLASLNITQSASTKKSETLNIHAARPNGACAASLNHAVGPPTQKKI
jgi:hypothetical protein